VDRLPQAAATNASRRHRLVNEKRLARLRPLDGPAPTGPRARWTWPRRCHEQNAPSCVGPDLITKTFARRWTRGLPAVRTCPFQRPPIFGRSGRSRTALSPTCVAERGGHGSYAGGKDKTSQQIPAPALKTNCRKTPNRSTLLPPTFAPCASDAQRLLGWLDKRPAKTLMHPAPFRHFLSLLRGWALVCSVFLGLGMPANQRGFNAFASSRSHLCAGRGRADLFHLSTWAPPSVRSKPYPMADKAGCRARRRFVRGRWS